MSIQLDDDGPMCLKVPQSISKKEFFRQACAMLEQTSDSVELTDVSNAEALEDKYFFKDHARFKFHTKKKVCRYLVINTIE